MIGKRFWLAMVALLGATAFLVPPSSADDPKPTNQARQEAQANDVELLAQAYKLAEFADKHKAPEAYVTAGALVLKLNAQTKGKLGKLEVKPEVQDEAGKLVKGAEAKTEEAEGLQDVAEGFLDQASKLAKDLKMSPEVEALIKAAKSRRYTDDLEKRGAIGGPKLVVRVLPPKQTHVYEILFDTYSIGALGFQASAPTRCKMQHGSSVHFNQLVTVGQYTWKPNQKAGPVGGFMVTVHNPHKVPVMYRLFTN